MRFIITICIFVCVTKLSGQVYSPYLSNSIHERTSVLRSKLDCNLHDGIRPINPNFSSKFYSSDTLLYFPDEDFRFSNTWVGRKLFSENLILIDSSDFKIAINPLFNFENGKELEMKDKVYFNTRGLSIGGSIGNKISFYTNFYENQARFPLYVDNEIYYSGVIPGEIRGKNFKEANRSYDYSVVNAFITYSPNKYLSFRFGQDKHFIGYGYRSLLLSDYSPNYLFLSTEIQKGKWQYFNMFASFINPDLVPWINYNGAGWLGNYQKKNANFNYLNFNACKRFQIGLFSSVIFETADSDDDYVRKDIAGIVVPEYPLFFSLNGKNNMMLGLNARLKVTNTLSAYSQFVLDGSNKPADRQNNKTAYQFGLKYLSAFGIQNLNLRLEYNYVSPFTYSQSNISQAYTNYNNPLTHPLGANFNEIVFESSWQYKRFRIENVFTSAQIGVNKNDFSFGQNVFMSDTLFDNSSYIDNIEHNKAIILNNNFRAGYLLNPLTNMYLYLGFNFRKTDFISANTYSKYFYISFITDLKNKYFNF